MVEITPELLLRAYAHGMFPMADSADSPELYWFDPPRRGILPLDEGFHVGRRLRRTVRRAPFAVRYDTAFEAVVRACAEPAADRPKTWINDRIVGLYTALHGAGHAHSVECWADDGEGGDRLVGGLYGVSLRAAFFGESMFSRADDSSKVALVHLVASLRAAGFRLLDTQFTTGHLAGFGGHEIPQGEYKRRLEDALRRPARFAPARPEAVDELLNNPPHPPADAGPSPSHKGRG